MPSRVEEAAIAPQFFASWDGTRLAWRELGEGRPAVLLHGFFSDGQTNWIRYGHAAALAAEGFRVIVPDLRAHGDSDKPHDPAAYPPDALTRDGHALIAHLGLGDYDLVGYSLGARTVSRMLTTGSTPRRVVFSGMGLEGLTDTGRRAGHFRDILTNIGRHERGSPKWMAEQFLRTTKGDPVALLGIIDTFVDTPLESIKGFAWPTAIVCGAEDQDNGSGPDLAAALPDAQFFEVPGGHMSSVIKPELGQAIARFLAA
ncbi:alpha/beta fold hydrolase [Sphingomonas sp.]|jgi:pimeloyl-ACP methyl ester carboxylesterase|uniref:alpha/beta fold hydrolase n=1 Tax=Sphingomonas sp. TaxID=28214 RepID=UPI002D7E788D|nr:alpha/beta fold hydrolase [Sphingomonas sp.]HEU0044877.1 alpha/beta fold hydrolase [Sphingomonas sp.]